MTTTKCFLFLLFTRIFFASSFPNIPQNSGINTVNELFKNATTTTISPCTDFYEYVCSEHRFYTNSSTNRSTAEEEANTFSDQLLEEAFTSQAILNSSNSLAVRFLLDLHQECLEQQSRETFFEILKTDLKLLKGNGTAGENLFVETDSGVVEEEGNSTTNLQKWIDYFVNYYTMTGEGMIIDMDMMPDFKNHSVMRLVLHYSTYILRVISSVPANLNTTLETIQKLVELHRKLSSNSELSDRVMEQVQKQGPITLAQLGFETAINWTTVFNRIFLQSGASLTVTEVELIYADVKFLKYVLGVISSTPARVIQNYVTMQYVAFMGTVYSSDCQYEEETNVARMFSFISSRIYVDAFIRKNFHSELSQMRQHVTDMVISIKRAFQNILADNQTDTKAALKLAQMKSSVGYADWILDDQKLDTWYGMHLEKTPRVVKGDYMGSLRVWIRHWIQVHFSRKSDGEAEHFWGYAVSMTNAWNHRVINRVYIPLGHLSPSLFNTSAPSTTKYGILGFTIGHEIAHSFTVKIGEYSIFANNYKCLEEQYSSIVDQATGKNLNGTQTLYENFADNFGLKAAYDALFKQNQTELNSVLNKKEFFYSFASRFCVHSLDSGNVDNLIESMQTHSINKYRVNVPLANFEQFSKLFECPIGSSMNPVKKCLIL